VSLRQAQRALWRAVRFDPTPDDALDFFDGDARLDASGRLAIYRRMYWLRQVHALDQAFPRLAEQLGEQAFTRLCCSYLRHYPSSHHALEYLGASLPHFIAQRQPELAGLCRLEWAHTLALLAPDAPAKCTASEARPDSFASARFGFAPSLQRVDVDAFALQAFGAGPQPASRPTSIPVVVFRRGFAVRHVALDESEARALDLARGGACVAEVLEDFAADAGGIERAFGLLRGWFARGYICAVEVPGVIE